MSAVCISGNHTAKFEEDVTIFHLFYFLNEFSIKIIPEYTSVTMLCDNVTNSDNVVTACEDKSRLLSTCALSQCHKSASANKEQIRNKYFLPCSFFLFFFARLIKFPRSCSVDHSLVTS